VILCPGRPNPGTLQAGSRSNSETFQLPDREQRQRRDRELKARYMANLDWLYGDDAGADTSDVLGRR
jgi:hypothetical protein